MGQELSSSRNQTSDANSDFSVIFAPQIYLRPASSESLVLIRFSVDTGQIRLLSSYLSEATKRRSRCGLVRGRPVLSSHFSPGFAPHVGQRTASASFVLAFIGP
jgi:hypothetical protein